MTLYFASRLSMRFAPFWESLEDPGQGFPVTLKDVKDWAE
jgi:hypothetical protein